MEQQLITMRQDLEIFDLPLSQINHNNLALPVLQALAPTTNQILLIHIPDSQYNFPYTLLQIISKQKVQIIQNGFFPCMLQQCKLLNKNVLAALGGFRQTKIQKDSKKVSQVKIQQFQYQESIEKQEIDNVNRPINTLFFYNFRTGTLLGRLQISLSEIYNQRCFFDLYFSSNNRKLYNTDLPLVIFYKISQFKSINDNRGTLDYQIGVYSLDHTEEHQKLRFNRIKKYKEDFSTHHSIIYFQEQIVAIENSGYSIQVFFFESKQRIIINSIYSLLLIDIKPHQCSQKGQQSHSFKAKHKLNSKQLLLCNKSYLELIFSHDQLQNQQVLLYAIEKSGIVTKIGKKTLLPNYQTQIMCSQNRSFQCKSIFQIKSLPNCQQKGKQIVKIKMKVSLEQKTKYFFIIDSKLKETGNQFKEAIMQLLE